MINQKIQKYFLPLVLLIGLFMRLPHLNGSFWLDEAAQALESRRPLAEQYKIADDFQPPLLHYIVHAELWVTHEEAGLRVISLVAGLFSIAFVYILIKDTAGERAAMASSLLLALNPFHIYFSQELRPYALATMFACLSWMALLKHKKVFFVLATIGGMYSMYLFPFVSLAQFLFILFERKSQTRAFLTQSVISYLFFLPWLPFFIGQLRVGTGLTNLLPGWSQAVSTPQIKAIPLTLAKFIVGSVELKDSILYVFLASIVLAFCAVSVLSVWKKKEARFLVYWFLVPIVVAWLVSFFIPVIQPKRVMLSLPPFIGILSWMVVQKEIWKKLCVFGVAAIFLCMSVLYFIIPKYQREDWRGLIHTVESSASSGKNIAIFAFPDPFAPWVWYSSGRIDSLATRMLHVDHVSQLQKPFSSLSGAQRMFVFDYLRDLTDPNHSIDEWMSMSGNQQIELIDGGNVGFVRVYESRYNKMANR